MKDKKKKIKNNSIIISFFYIKSNDRYRLLNESAIPSYKIDKAAISYLEKEKLVRETETVGQYTITAKGVWEMEKQNEILNDSIIVDYIDQKFFNLYTKVDKPFSEKQKVIILSFIATRSFSADSVIDLKTNDKRLNKLKEIIDESYHLLKTLNLISKLQYKELYRSKTVGNEHIVSHLLRHTDALPKITKGIFNAKGKQKYYLDLYKEDTFSEKDLIFLFQKLFDHKKLHYSNLEKLNKFFVEIAHNYNIYLFQIDKHIFTKSKFDQIIKDILFVKL